MTTFGGKTVPPLFEALGGSFTVGPINLLDSDTTWSYPAGDNRDSALVFRISVPNRGTLVVGDGFNGFQGATVQPQLPLPQWHVLAPNAPLAGIDGTGAFEVAILSIQQNPIDFPARFPGSGDTPIVTGVYKEMGATPMLFIGSSAADPAGTIRTFQGVFSIRRRTTLELMAQADITFRTEKT